MKKIAAGNWKMNGSLASLIELSELAKRPEESTVDILICPPTIYIQSALSIAGSIKIGAQDCHMYQSGAYTGDVSASMLADLGVTAVIVGHSERRIKHSESNIMVLRKALAAQASGIIPIICIGETLSQREGGQTLDVIEDQMNVSLHKDLTLFPFIIAYEPVWAIGTGHIPSSEQIAEVHTFCRKYLKKKFEKIAANTPLLYGGSVNGINADKIFAIPNVDGALVGKSSLKADDFSQIIVALEKS